MNAGIDVEIERKETWPAEFLLSGTANRQLILAYQQELRRIELLGREDIFARIHPPHNAHKAPYETVVNQLDDLLARHRIVGYHCTRLTTGEIRKIRSNGLKVLSGDLVRQRLTACVVDGHMTPAEHDYLVNSSRLRDSLSDMYGHRTGMIWLCPNQSTLRSAPYVYRLFRSWGGEAVYGGHEMDPEIASVRTRIGTPAIVKCAIPFDRSPPYHPKFAARFLSQFMADEIDYPDPPAEFDLCTRSDIPSAQILGIIEWADPLFDALTGYSTWQAHYRVHSAS